MNKLLVSAHLFRQVLVQAPQSPSSNRRRRQERKRAVLQPFKADMSNSCIVFLEKQQRHLRKGVQLRLKGFGKAKDSSVPAEEQPGPETTEKANTASTSSSKSAHDKSGQARQDDAAQGDRYLALWNRFLDADEMAKPLVMQELRDLILVVFTQEFDKGSEGILAGWSKTQVAKLVKDVGEIQVKLSSEFEIFLNRSDNLEALDSKVANQVRTCLIAIDDPGELFKLSKRVPFPHRRLLLAVPLVVLHRVTNKWSSGCRRLVSSLNAGFPVSPGLSGYFVEDLKNEEDTGFRFSQRLVRTDGLSPKTLLESGSFEGQTEIFDEELENILFSYWGKAVPNGFRSHKFFELLDSLTADETQMFRDALADLVFRLRNWKLVADLEFLRSKENSLVTTEELFETRKELVAIWEEAFDRCDRSAKRSRKTQAH